MCIDLYSAYVILIQLEGISLYKIIPYKSGTFLRIIQKEVFVFYLWILANRILKKVLFDSLKFRYYWLKTSVVRLLRLYMNLKKVKVILGNILLLT